MITEQPPAGAAEFEGERPRLLGLAYRITGSRTTADDIVQDAWLRWQRADHATIERPAAWLTTVTSRLALDHLKSAQHQRETYVGPWLPEVAVAEPGPAEHAELAESVTLGFLTVLERLGPVERVVFLLTDVFQVPSDEVAEVVGRSPEACRQVASRARSRVREGRPRFAPTDDEAWQVTAAFLAAAQAGDLESLVSLLADDALAVSDGGAEHRAARHPIVASRIPRFVANLTSRAPEGTTYTFQLVNGQPAVVCWLEGVAFDAIVFGVAGGLVQRISSVVNPAKLATLDSAPIS